MNLNPDMTVFQISVLGCFSWKNDAAGKMNVNLAKQKEFPNQEGNPASELLLQEDKTSCRDRV